MAVTEEDLRLWLDEPASAWTGDQSARATFFITRCLARIVGYIGRDPYQASVEEQDDVASGLVDEITLAFAARRFVNAEQALQRRQGTDSSVSFADGSEASTGLTSAEKSALDDAFSRHGSGSFVAAWNSSEVEPSWMPRIGLD